MAFKKVMAYGLGLLLVAAAVPLAQAASATPTATVKQKPRMEVCFVLDTTGSMSGLIEGAKQKIWSIANGILVSAKPTPELRIGLIGYRDRGDERATHIRSDGRHRRRWQW